MPSNPWGLTSPYLKISRQFGVDYGDVLMIAHGRTKGVTLPGALAAADRLIHQLGPRLPDLERQVDLVVLAVKNSTKA